MGIYTKGIALAVLGALGGCAMSPARVAQLPTQELCVDQAEAQINGVASEGAMQTRVRAADIDAALSERARPATTLIMKRSRRSGLNCSKSVTPQWRLHWLVWRQHTTKPFMHRVRKSCQRPDLPRLRLCTTAPRTRRIFRRNHNRQPFLLRPRLSVRN